MLIPGGRYYTHIALDYLCHFSRMSAYAKAIYVMVNKEAGTKEVLKLEEQMIDKLKDIIYVQFKLMKELLSVLEQEKTALLDIDLEALAEINELKKSAIVNINTHTNPLRETVEAVATDSGLPSNTPFVEVVVQLGKQGIMEIPRLYQDLKGLATQVREAAALNQEIAEQSVSMIKSALLLLAHIVDQSTTYNFSGGYYQWQVDAIMINKKV